MKQNVVTETVLLQTLTVHAFLMTRNGIGRKEKEGKSTAGSFCTHGIEFFSISNFRNSEFFFLFTFWNNPSYCLFLLRTFPEWMHLFDWCRTSSAKCWNRAKVDFGLCIWGEGRGVGWGRGGGPIRDLVSHSMQLPLPTVQYCSQPLKKKHFLSDPSPINGYACQWLPPSLTAV